MKMEKPVPKSPKATKPAKTAEYKPDLSYLKSWSTNKNIKKSVEELEAKLIEIYTEIKDEHGTDWDEEKCWTKARQRLYATFKSSMKSTNAPWKVKLDCIQPAFDFGNSHYLKNLAAFDKNPQNALSKGLVRKHFDAVGKKQVVEPLEERKLNDFGKPRKGYGKPLKEHNWIQTVIALAIPTGKLQAQDWNALKVSYITISGDQADPTSDKYISNVETGQWYDAELTNKTPADNDETYLLNATKLTKFKLSENIEISNEDLPSYYDGFFVPIAEIEEYHDSYAEPAKKPDGSPDDNKTMSKRLCMTKGQVIDIVLGEEGNNHRIVLDDESIGFSEDDYQESINCWFGGEINFGKFSEIYVFGTTQKQRKKDLATGEFVEDWNLPTINVGGIIVTDLVEPEIDEEEAGDAEEESEEESEEDVEVEEPDINQTEEETTEEEATEEVEEKPVPKPTPKPVSKIKPKEEKKEDVDEGKTKILPKKASKKSSKPKVKPQIEESEEESEEETVDAKDLVESDEW